MVEGIKLICDAVTTMTGIFVFGWIVTSVSRSLFRG